MMEKFKATLALISGWLVAVSIAAFYLLSHRDKVVLPPAIAPKLVPADPEKRDEELRKRGLIK